MMKISNVLKYGLLAFLLFFVTACSGASSKPTIKVLNLKPEIDEALKAYAKEYSAANDVNVVIETCGGSNCDFGTKMDTYVAAGQTPDIFLMEGRGGFEKYGELAMDLSDQPWVKDTDYAFMDNGKAYGFPLGVEGFGLTYNKDILDKAGINPASLTSFSAYEEAFAKLNSMKDELGITAPVAMAAGTGMYWVGGLHAFNSYLSGGLSLDDTSVIDALNNGEVKADRLNDYANMIELIYNNSETSILTAAGDQYAAQVKLFTDGKTAFLHQGNWVDGDLEAAGMKNVGIAPAPFGGSNNTYIAAPSFFFVHKDSANADIAVDFLNSIHGTEAGQNFMYVEAKSISPFRSVNIVPETPLAKSVYEQLQQGNASPWNQNDMPAEFGMQRLGPVHEQFARGSITKEQFIEQITRQIETLK